MNHIPVLLKETLEMLSPREGENFIDATIGGGGHAMAILDRTAPTGKLLGIDASRDAIEAIAKKSVNQFNKRLISVCGNFSDLQNIVGEHRFDPVHGILADLGFSSLELGASGRGFSFMRDEPLDMRYGEGGLTAEEIINDWPEEDLTKIFQNYGEEGFSRQIANKIIETRKIRKIRTTGELVNIIQKATPNCQIQRRPRRPELAG